MRAEDYVHSKYSFGCETRRVWELEKIVALMEGYANQKALQVSTEAVEEELENVPKKEVWVACDVSDLIHRVSDNILKNIKKRLNDENSPDSKQ